MNTKYVLIIEDDREIIFKWATALRRFPIELTPAVSLEEAERLFLTKKNWDLIVVDGCLGGDEFNTEELVRTIRTRKFYYGPMIAASKSPELRKLLLHAGCSDQADKSFVPAIIMKHLKL